MAGAENYSGDGVVGWAALLFAVIHGTSGPGMVQRDPPRPVSLSALFAFESRFSPGSAFLPVRRRAGIFDRRAVAALVGTVRRIRHIVRRKRASDAAADSARCPE